MSCKLKTDLLPVIGKGEFFELEQEKTEVSGFLTSLLDLDENERRFLTEFKTKRYMPELLFEDIEILDRVKEHPMALRKMQNR